jgi:hypothetical protein
MRKEKKEFDRNNKKFNDILTYISNYENLFNRYNMKLKEYHEKKYYRMAQLILKNNK